jgi:4-hydroxy-4-methyl-2-oxoglutarate aldolase
MIDQFAQMGVATIYEASGRNGLIDSPLERLIPNSKVAGLARTVLCAQGDNLMMHAVLATVQRGEILVLTMPEPEAVALIGDLLVTQAIECGVAGILVNAAVRDADELRQMGLPIWTRFIRAKGATRISLGALNTPVQIGGVVIHPKDLVVMDGDGAVAVPAAKIETVYEASLARISRETELRQRFAAGQLSLDVYGLRQQVQSLLEPS